MILSQNSRYESPKHPRKNMEWSDPDSKKKASAAIWVQRKVMFWSGPPYTWKMVTSGMAQEPLKTSMENEFMSMLGCISFSRISFDFPTRSFRTAQLCWNTTDLHRVALFNAKCNLAPPYSPMYNKSVKYFCGLRYAWKVGVIFSIVEKSWSAQKKSWSFGTIAV